jgi:DNA-binding NtrC family response regulator
MKSNPGATTLDDSPTAKTWAQAIIVSDNLSREHVVMSVLRSFSIRPVGVESPADIQVLLADDKTVVVFCQASFGGKNYRLVLDEMITCAPRVPVVVCSPAHDQRLFVEAMTCGAFDYICAPYDRKEVEWVVTLALNWGPTFRGTPRFGLRHSTRPYAF